MRLIQTLPVLGLLARAIAVVAMLVQVAFFAEHTGAVAARSLGGVAPEARLGFLEICTGSGVDTILPDGGAPAHGTGCPICANASVLGFSQPDVLDAPAFPAFALSDVLEPGAPASLTSAPLPRSNPIRAPPVA